MGNMIVFSDNKENYVMESKRKGRALAIVNRRGRRCIKVLHERKRMECEELQIWKEIKK